MKNIDERVANLKSELIIMKKRISDITLLEIQKKIDKIKEITDNEVNRRTKNLGNQGSLH